jgi:hypothetical protein
MLSTTDRGKVEAPWGDSGRAETPYALAVAEEVSGNGETSVPGVVKVQ